MPGLELDEPTADEVSTALEVFKEWQEGAQEGAMERLRPLAGAERPWALSFLSWLYMQRGVPEMAKGIPYAKRAAELGMPWASANLFSTMVGNATSFPDGIESALDLINHPGPVWSGFDPVNSGWNLIAQGRAAEGVRLMGLRSVFPVTDQEWVAMSESARNQAGEISAALNRAKAAEAEVGTAAAAHLVAMGKAESDLETRAKQAQLMVTTVTSEATGALFTKDANSNKKESKTAWVSGLVVLAAAAAVAVAPLLLHYLGRGPDYSTGALFGAHAGSTAALATVAGVLLARARSRDLARQRASDLSIAMGTMITYSNQISDDAERQRFMTTMGQLVLQAHLTTGTQGHQAEESLTGLIALANVMKPGNPGSSS
ncbi:hypothetical protein AB0F44_23835 [Nocardioides sp. NPDC023903]|uniref:hypothetical protein n=1 Tax=Nocardioides sp. NPDC023903 TaxID=3157195 RepID=UPI0033F427EC